MQRDLAPWYVALGASGSEGLHDLKTLAARLPAALPAVVMMVLHRPVDQISNLRPILAKEAHLHVVIAGPGERLEAGTIYIGEPDEHLRLAEMNLGELVHGADNDYRNRTVDLLFLSLARHAGPRTIGVVLSGSLDDGSRGLEAIHRAGGVTMAVSPRQGGRGMPENAAAYDGPLDVVGSVEDIAAAITATVTEGEGRPSRPLAVPGSRPA